MAKTVKELKEMLEKIEDENMEVEISTINWQTGDEVYSKITNGTYENGKFIIASRYNG